MSSTDVVSFGVQRWWCVCVVVVGWGVLFLTRVFYSAGTATVKTEIFLTNVNRTGTD